MTHAGQLSMRTILLFCLVLFGMLPSCKKQRHNVKKLKPLSSYIDYEQTRDNINLRVKRLCANDCAELFGDCGKKLTRGIRSTLVPLQISIYNKSSQLAVLKPEFIDLPLASPKKAVKRLQQSTFLHAMGSAINGIFVTGLIGAGGLSALAIGSMIAFAPLIIFGTVTVITTPLLLIIGTPIAATIEGISSARINATIKKDVKEKTLAHALIVEPGHSVETLVFVEKRHYHPTFEISLMNRENKSTVTTFMVTLPEK